jgi:hypothetical protein
LHCLQAILSAYAQEHLSTAHACDGRVYAFVWLGLTSSHSEAVLLIFS